MILRLQLLADVACGPSGVTAEGERKELTVSVSAPSATTQPVASPRGPVGLPEHSLGACRPDITGSSEPSGITTNEKYQ